MWKNMQFRFLVLFSCPKVKDNQGDDYDYGDEVIGVFPSIYRFFVLARVYVGGHLKGKQNELKHVQFSKWSGE